MTIFYNEKKLIDETGIIATGQSLVRDTVMFSGNDYKQDGRIWIDVSSFSGGGFIQFDVYAVVNRLEVLIESVSQFTGVGCKNVIIEAMPRYVRIKWNVNGSPTVDFTVHSTR